MEDLAPGSTRLHELNDSYTPPTIRIYRAHAARVFELAGTDFGFFTSQEERNDCFVGESSVSGPGGVFNSPFNVMRLYIGLVHATDLRQCGGHTKITDSSAVVDSAIEDIVANPQGGAPAAPAAAPTPPALVEDGLPLIDRFTAVISPGETKQYVASVPSGLSAVSFALFSPVAETPVGLSIMLTRPDGSQVLASSPDVLSSWTGAGADAFHLYSTGYKISSPAQGAWHVDVQGDPLPAQGQPFSVLAVPQSPISLRAGVAQPLVQQGAPEVIRASLFDGTNALTPTAISATVTLINGSTEAVILNDTGIDGDATSGDNIFSGSFSNTAICGTYRVLFTASGVGAEFPLVRKQIAAFNVGVPTNTTRDPCSADDDGDGLTDATEETLGTNPLNPDTDGDGLSDGAEVNTYATNPLNYDSDGDGLADGAEVNTYATNPLNPDSDGDLVSDGPLATAGVSAGPDNCPSVANAHQLNTDAANTRVNRAGARARRRLRRRHRRLQCRSGARPRRKRILLRYRADVDGDRA